MIGEDNDIIPADIVDLLAAAADEDAAAAFTYDGDGFNGMVTPGHHGDPGLVQLHLLACHVDAVAGALEAHPEDVANDAVQALHKMRAAQDGT